MIAMVWAFAEQLEPNMVFNWDATQFGVSKDSGNDVVYIKNECDDDLPLTVESGGETCIFIKYYFHNAADDCAQAVYLIADSEMTSDALETYEIPGLGNGSELASRGWLCICKSRQANTKFYEWFGEHIVVPYVSDSRSIYDSKNADDSQMRAFVTCDGEEAQIRVFQEERMLQKFSTALIDFGKTPASCSAICQSSDVSDYFLALKKTLSCLEGDIWVKNHLSKKIKQIFNSRVRNGISSVNQTKIIVGLQKINYCMNKVLNKKIIVDGYVRTGQNAPIGFDATGEPTMSKFYAQMSLCKSNISVPEMKILLDSFPQMVQLMRQKGTVTESEMDALNIPSVNHLDLDRKPKDQRALHKQRAVIMNKDDCINSYKTYQIRKQQKNQNTKARKGKKDEIQLSKQAEKLRRASLTPLQKKVEDNAKRNAKNAAKRAATKLALKIQEESDEDFEFEGESDDDIDDPTYPDEDEDSEDY
jgi:hypothetical protein